MNIYVLDTSFKVIDVIDEYISVIWTRRYFSYGDFELYLMASENNLDILSAGNYLVREQDIVSQNEFHNVMIISNRDIKTDVENGDNIIVTGYCLKSILKRRIIPNQTTLSGTVENCITHLLKDNIINPSNTARAITNFVLGTNSIINSNTMQRQITGDNLSEAITEICMTYGYGYDVYISNGNFVFYIYEGADRSYDQTANPYIIFSTEFDNLITSDYVQNNDNYANAAVVAGEGEGDERKKVTVGTASGLNRYEVWIDARNSLSNNGEISESDYLNMLRQEGVEELSELTTTTSFEGEVDDTTNFVIGKDYFLGDCVQVENDYGISAKTRIIEVIESEDENGSDIIPTFSEMEV